MVKHRLLINYRVFTTQIWSAWKMWQANAISHIMLHFLIHFPAILSAIYDKLWHKKLGFKGALFVICVSDIFVVQTCRANAIFSEHRYKSYTSANAYIGYPEYITDISFHFMISWKNINKHTGEHCDQYNMQSICRSKDQNTENGVNNFAQNTSPINIHVQENIMGNNDHLIEVAQKI